MDRKGYHTQAVNMLGWIFGWYKDKYQYKVPYGFHIHHIDRDYTNNSLDNLAILTVEEHMKIHKEDNKQYSKIGSKKVKEKYGKKVLCVETGIVYESLGEASRQTGIAYTHISEVCNGKPKRKTAGGYHWKFVCDDG